MYELFKNRSLIFSERNTHFLSFNLLIENIVFFKTSNEMEAYTSNFGLLSHSLTRSRICPHNALVSHLKLFPGFRACFFICK